MASARLALWGKAPQNVQTNILFNIVNYNKGTVFLPGPCWFDPEPLPHTEQQISSPQNRLDTFSADLLGSIQA